MTLNSQKVYLQILLKFFLVKAKIVFYYIEKNLRGLFFGLLQLFFLYALIVQIESLFFICINDLGISY